MCDFSSITRSGSSGHVSALSRILLELTIESEREPNSAQDFGTSTPGRGEKRRLVILSASDRGAVEIQEDHDENWEIPELVLGVIRCSRIAGNPWNGE
jgi:hypothetical protein